REGRDDLAWLAWIPIVNSFLLTLLVEQAVHKDLRGKLTLIYGISLAVGIIIGGFFTFIAIIPQVVIIYAFFFLAKRYSTNPVLHLVIAIVTLGVSMAFQIFFLRNKAVQD